MKVKWVFLIVLLTINVLYAQKPEAVINKVSFAKPNETNLSFNANLEKVLYGEPDEIAIFLNSKQIHKEILALTPKECVKTEQLLLNLEMRLKAEGNTNLFFSSKSGNNDNTELLTERLLEQLQQIKTMVLKNRLNTEIKTTNTIQYKTDFVTNIKSGSATELVADKESFEKKHEEEIRLQMEKNWQNYMAQRKGAKSVSSTPVAKTQGNSNNVGQQPAGQNLVTAKTNAELKQEMELQMRERAEQCYTYYTKTRKHNDANPQLKSASLTTNAINNRANTQTNQPEPFLSELVCFDQWNNSFGEIANPGNIPLD